MKHQQAREMQVVQRRVLSGENYLRAYCCCLFGCHCWSVTKIDVIVLLTRASEII